MIRYDKQVIIALKKSEEEAFNLMDQFVDAEHFVLAVLSFKNSIRTLLNRYAITYDIFKAELLKINRTKKTNNNSFVFYTSNFKKIIDSSSDNAAQFSSQDVMLEHIFMSIIEDDENHATKILEGFKIDLDIIYKDLTKLSKSGKALLVHELGTNLNDLAKSKLLDKVIGREDEIKQIINILARKNKNNPILIGEAGVGKTALVEELSKRIVKGDVPEFLKDKVLISLNVASIISGTKYRGEFEEKLTKILKECEDTDDVIIFIDEVHTIVGAGGAEGAIDASNILKPVLARGNLKIVGATTINEYKKFVASDKALDRRFQKIYINAPSESETLNILLKIKKDYEKFHNVKISEDMVKKIVSLSNKYIFDRSEPDKSIDILDEVCALTSVNSESQIDDKLKKDLKNIIKAKENAIKSENYSEAESLKIKEQKIINKMTSSKKIINEVTLSALKKIIESKCNGKIHEFNNKKYKELEECLNNKIIGQASAIKEIVNITKLDDNKFDATPISMLLAGPSGVGKTETAYQLSKLCVKNIIKLDMSEYTSEISVNKILGSLQGYIGYNDNNCALEEIKLNPNSIILLDEIEKAHPVVINLFLNVVETGILKNSKGETLNFNNAIFIITSNEYKPNAPLGYINSGGKLFEGLPQNLMSRVNHTIVFNSLNKNNIKKIIDLKLTELNKEYKRNIVLSQEQIEKAINESNYKTFGARNIKNVLKKHLEKLLIISSTL